MGRGIRFRALCSTLMAAALLVWAVAGECMAVQAPAGVAVVPAACCLPDGSCGSANMARCPKAQLNSPAVLDDAPALVPVLAVALALPSDCPQVPQAEIVPAHLPDPHLLKTSLRI